MTDLDRLLAEFKRLHPKLIDLSLGRIERLLARLGHPERRLANVVHIAGTNGKGSTTATLKAIIEAAGRTVHVYTSPHLVRFNERIAIPGSDGISQPIDETHLVDILERVAHVNAGDPITFFEVTTAAAFLAFAERPADAVILEVGLGGRLDATNVLERPALSVITPISLDHTDRLGSTIELIAAEKAGILKRNVTAIAARQEPAVDDVLSEVAGRVGANLRRWGEHHDAYAQRGRLVFQGHDRLLDLPMTALAGAHQIVNAGTAIAAALELGGLGIDEAAIEAGLQRVRWPARMQRLGEGRLTVTLPADWELWLDGGHNPAAGVALARAFADLEERSPRPLILVVGMMGHKDAAGFLQPFTGLARRIVAVPVPGAPENAATPADLARIAGDVGLQASTAPSVSGALAGLAREEAGLRRILIAGSLYLAGHVLADQRGETMQPN